MRLLTSFPISSIGIDAHQTGKGNRVKAVYMNSPFLIFYQLRKRYHYQRYFEKLTLRNLKKMGKKEKLLQNLQKVNEALAQQAQFREWILQALAEGKRTSAGETQHRKLEILERRIRKDTGLKQDIEAILASEYGYLQ